MDAPPVLLFLARLFTVHADRHGPTMVRLILGSDIHLWHRLPEQPPVFGPSRLVDFELETGFFVGPGNQLGHPIPVDQVHMVDVTQCCGFITVM